MTSSTRARHRPSEPGHSRDRTSKAPRRVSSDELAPKSRKGERTRASLIAAALRVFAERGYLNTKITDITAEAGIANGSFYNYFKDKKELLRSITTDFRDQLPHMLKAEWEGDVHPLVAIAKAVELYVRAYLSHQAVVAGILQASVVDETFAELWQETRAEGIGIAVRHLRQAQRLGFATDLDVELAASALCNLIEFSCYNWNSVKIDFPDRDVSEEEAIQALVTMALSCLGWGKECAEVDAYLKDLNARLGNPLKPRHRQSGGRRKKAS